MFLQGILWNRYFLGHLQLPEQAFNEWALKHPDWMKRLTENALDEIKLQLTAQAIAEAVGERMARS
ncbi:hypothetical protein ACFO6Y_26850 [Cupriavidus pinatubonensis]